MADHDPVSGAAGDRSNALSEEVRRALEQGDAHFAKQRYRAAIQTWSAALEGGQDGAKLNEAERAELHDRIASAYFARSQLSIGSRASKKSLKRGLERLEEAVRWNPQNALYTFETARCHWRLEARERALLLFEMALLCPGATPEMRYYTAVAQLRSGEPKKALKTLSKRPSGKEWQRRRHDWVLLEACAIGASSTPNAALVHLMEQAAKEPDNTWIGHILKLAVSAQPSEELCTHLSTVVQACEASEGVSTAATAKLQRLLGDMQAILGNDDDAIAWWRRTAELQGGQDEAQKICATCERRALEALEARDLEAAFRWCRIGLETTPDEPNLKRLHELLQLHTAEVHWDQGDSAKAIGVWRDLMEGHNALDASWNVAVASELANDLEQAVTAWTHVLDIAESMKVAQGRTAAIRAACLQVQLGENAGARALVHRAPSTDGEEPWAPRLRVTLSLLADPPNEAAQVLERALTTAPDDAEMLTTLAAVYDASDAPLEDKIARWRAALVRSDEDWVRDAWRLRTLELGRQKWQSGDLDKAMDVFASLLLDNRSEPDGWIWCGTIHLQRGDVERAGVCFDQALSFSSQTADPLVQIGGCYLMASREKEAHEYFRRAQQAEPSAATDMKIAEVCVEVGRKDVAFTFLTEAVNHSETHSPQLYRIAQILVEIREGHQLIPLLESVAQVIDKPYRMEYLIAIEHILSSDWQAAPAALDRVHEAAVAHEDAALVEDILFTERALILFLTTGSIDRNEVANRMRQAVKRWIGEEPVNTYEAPIERIRRQAQSLLVETVNEVLSQSPQMRRTTQERPEAKTQLNLPSFSQPFHVDALAPDSIDKVTA